MEDYLEYIDAYFQRMLDPEEIKRFEQRIAEDPEFADEVAFYLSAKQSLKVEADREKKEWFRELLAQQRPLIDINQYRSAKRIWIYRASAAAAVIVCAFFAWYFFFSNNSATTQQMADNYVNENFKNLPVTMSAELDSTQTGLRLYNEGKYDSALSLFEMISQRDSRNDLLKKYLGIVYLRLANYDKALLYFRFLENYSLYSNPAIFYQALTLMKRNQSGDKEKAKQLLQQVVEGNLEGKTVAQRWLKNW